MPAGLRADERHDFLHLWVPTWINGDTLITGSNTGYMLGGPVDFASMLCVIYAASAPTSRRRIYRDQPGMESPTAAWSSRAVRRRRSVLIGSKMLNEEQNMG